MTLWTSHSPDIYRLDRFVVAERASTGLLEPLDGNLDTKKPSAQYLPFAWAETQYKGQTYAPSAPAVPGRGRQTDRGPVEQGGGWSWCPGRKDGGTHQYRLRTAQWNRTVPGLH